MKINEIVCVVIQKGRLVYQADYDQDAFLDTWRWGAIEVRTLMPVNGDYTYIVLSKGKVLGTYSC